MYSTLDDQTFFDVCKSIGLASAQWKAYYEYIGEHFYRGHTWRGVEGAVHFLHPWGGAKSQSRFKPGEKFPIPSGEHWEKMMRLHKLRSNDSNTEYVNAKLAIAAELETLANEQYITKLRRLLESVGHSVGFAGALQTLGGSQRSAVVSAGAGCLNKI